MQCTTNHVHCTRTRKERVGMHSSEVSASHDKDDDEDEDGGEHSLIPPTNTEALKVKSTQSVNNSA